MAPSPWGFPDPTLGDDPSGLICTGGDLQPSTIVTAYCSGLFPMPVRRRLLGWWSPNPRGVLPLEELRVTRSLRRSQLRYEVRVDTSFDAVINACAELPRPHGWIDRNIVAAYIELHRLGIAHSYESWFEGTLVGGLYGLSIGGLFAGESMFHRATDASKVALCALVDDMASSGQQLLDVQWCTPHLASLGAVEVPRSDYIALLAAALDVSPVAPPISPPSE